MSGQYLVAPGNYLAGLNKFHKLASSDSFRFALEPKRFGPIWKQRRTPLTSSQSVGRTAVPLIDRLLSNIIKIISGFELFCRSFETFLALQCSPIDEGVRQAHRASKLRMLKASENF